MIGFAYAALCVGQASACVPETLQQAGAHMKASHRLCDSMRLSVGALCCVLTFCHDFYPRIGSILLIN